MSSVYGNILDHFPELVIELPYYNQVAKVGAGYTPIGDITYVQCIRQAGPGRKLSDSIKHNNSSTSPTLKINDNVSVWSYTRLLPGWFMTYDKEVYRIIGEKDWDLEAGFWSYELEKVIGNTGSPETELPIKTGVY